MKQGIPEGFLAALFAQRLGDAGELGDGFGERLRGQCPEPKYSKIRWIGGKHLAYSHSPQARGNLGVENAFAAKSMALHPIQEKQRGLACLKDVPNFGCLSPEAGFGHSLVGCQRLLKTAQVGHDMNEFSKDLRSERQRNLGFEDFAVQKFPGRRMGWRFNQFQLHQKRGVNAD